MLSTALCARGPGSGCCSWPKAAVRAARTAETGPSLVLSERAHMITLWMHNVTHACGGEVRQGAWRSWLVAVGWRWAWSNRRAKRRFWD
jgi:hypothetical protein